MKTLLAASFTLALLFSGCDKPPQKLKAHPPKYPVLTVEILKTIPDDELEVAVIEYVESKFEDEDGNERKIVTSLSKGFQMVYTTMSLEAEVNNGGFNQYFWNSTGGFQNEVLDGYKLLGASEHEKLTAQAIEIYNQHKDALDEQKAKGTVEAFSESYKDNPLNKLDDQFYNLKEDTSAMRIKFIREHPELFVGQ